MKDDPYRKLLPVPIIQEIQLCKNCVNFEILGKGNRQNSYCKKQEIYTPGEYRKTDFVTGEKIFSSSSTSVKTCHDTRTGPTCPDYKIKLFTKIFQYIGKIWTK